MNLRCKLARTSVMGRENPVKFEVPGDKGLYPGNVESDGGDRGDGNRSSSRRSLSPCLKAMVGRVAKLFI